MATKKKEGNMVRLVFWVLPSQKEKALQKGKKEGGLSAYGRKLLDNDK